MNEDLVDLAKRAAFIARILRILYRGIAGEDLTIESGIKHRPLLSVGLATGVGALAGWWLSDQVHRRSLPPPEPTAFDYLSDILPGGLDRVRNEIIPGVDRVRNEIIPNGMDRVRNEIIPGGVERVREALPASREEAVSNARSWLDTVLEPKIKEGLESAADNVPEDRVSTFLRDAARRLGTDDPSPDDNGHIPDA